MEILKTRLMQKACKKIGVKVISFTGNDGGLLKKESDLNFNVNSSSTQKNSRNAYNDWTHNL